MIACLSTRSSILSSSIQAGFCTGGLLVVISGTDISENLHLKGQNVQLTLSADGGSNIVPHNGQNGQDLTS